MTLRVCCSPGVVCNVAVPTHERLTGVPEAACLVAPWHQQNRAKRGGECESRDWRTISRSYSKSCQPTLPFVGRAPHACRSMLVQSKRILILLPWTRSARELSKAPPCALRNAALSRRAQQAPPSVASRNRLCSRKWIPEPPSSPGRRAHQLAQSSPPRFVVQAPPCVTSRGPPLLAQVDSPSRRARLRGLADLRHRRVPPCIRTGLSRALGRNALPDRKEGLSP